MASTPPPSADPPGFNEAAGIPRGRLGPGDAACDRAVRFNEAAGIPRGRRSSLRT